MSQQERFPCLQATVGKGHETHEGITIKGDLAAVRALAELLNRAVVAVEGLDTLPKGQLAFVSEEDFMHPEEGEAFSVFVLIEPDNWRGGDYGAD